MPVMTERKRRSPIWLASPEEFAAVIADCATQTEALARFGLRNAGGNAATLKERMREENLKLGRPYVRIPPNKGKIRPNAEVFCVDSTSNRYHLKNRIIQQGLISYVCFRCGLGPEWNGEPLTLILDHINGVPDDNRIENLRFACPNCNAQLPTHCGKHNRRGRLVESSHEESARLVMESSKNKYQIICSRCGLNKSRSVGNLCRRCIQKTQLKIEWPSVEDLRLMVEETNYSEVGRRLGVSDNAIRKHLRNHSGIV